jgi:protein-arginine kinase activator protein McsA
MTGSMGFVNSTRPQAQMTATPSLYPQGYFHNKPCKECGTSFSPAAVSHLYCSKECFDDNFYRKYFKRQYNIPLEEYRQMFVAQDHKCAICGEVGFKICKDSKALLVVDHCHTTSDVRGLLCHNCNRGLGLFQDSPTHLASAIRYLSTQGIYNQQSIH